MYIRENNVANRKFEFIKNFGKLPNGLIFSHLNYKHF